MAWLVSRLVPKGAALCRLASTSRILSDVRPITNGEDYLRSLAGRNLKIFLFGQLVPDPLSHPMIRPSINAVAETYDLAARDPELASVESPLIGKRVNRFLHVAQSRDDLVMQGKMQRRLGQLTGTCFQRCVGMDAINALHSTTFDMDAKHGTSYHARFLEWTKAMQQANYVIGGAMTDVKGDRGKAPHEQADPDLFVHVTRRTDEGVWISGAKAHQTGCLNSHWLLVMPTMRLGEKDREYAIVGAVPVDAEGITYIYGRQSCDTRSGASEIDAGNAQYGGQEAMIIFDEVFIPTAHVFMDGEHEHAATLVERFTGYHRRSYVCKSGVGDVLIGAAATAADYNGVDKVSHIKDKLVEMTHLNETIYATAMAASHQGTEMPSGAFQPDDMLANVCKHHVTKMPYEIARLAQDLAGGLMVTMPSEDDFRSADVGPLLEKYLKGRPGISTEARMRILRLIENMTLGRNAVGYLTESMHGAGSPQAQRIQMQRGGEIEFKKRLAQVLAGIIKEATTADERALPSGNKAAYMARVFAPASLKGCAAGGCGGGGCTTKKDTAFNAPSKTE